MFNNQYSVVMAEKPQALASFYQKHFHMEISFESDWYVSLKREGAHGVFQLALLRYDHPTVPEGFREKASGLLLNWEVSDVDEVYEELVKTADLPVHLDIRSEGWGQRHFIIADPEGNLNDVIQVIEPSPEFLAQYAEEVVQ